LSIGGETSGLAAGSDFLSATYRAILELAERHFFTSSTWPPGNRLFLNQNGICDSSYRLLSHFEAENIDVALWGSEVLPGFWLVYAATRDNYWPLPHLACGGTGFRPSVHDAIRSALLEAAQSRVTFLTLLRNDAPRVANEVASADTSGWFSTNSSSLEISKAPPSSASSMHQQLGQLLSKLWTDVTRSQNIVVPLVSGPPIYCVRVINYGLKRHWTMEERPK